MVFALIVSLTAALISSAIAWRLSRLERLRSTARVEALSAAIDDRVPSAADEFAWEVPASSKTEGAPELFSHAPTRSTAALLTAAVTVVAGIFVVVMMALLADGERSNPTVDVQTANALELLSMTHARDGSALVVTGVVRNASQTITAPLTTVVTALNGDGRVVGAGSATLAAVGPGDTQPFTVRLDDASAVGRYRVSFRTGSGVMPHVDRRRGHSSARVATE